MNYKRIYNQIIEKRRNCKPVGYTERHHIIPRSLGGDDSNDNLIDLTAREHFICHYLLAKIYERESFEWYKMNHAFMMMKLMSSNQERYFNSHLYESLRGNFSKVASANQQGNKNSQFGTRWIHSKIEKKSKKIGKNELLPVGWEEGRVLNFDNKKEFVLTPLDLCKDCKKQKYARDWYDLLLKSNSNSLREFVRKSSYPYSHVSFIKMLKTYIPEFETIQGQNFKT